MRSDWLVSPVRPVSRTIISGVVRSSERSGVALPLAAVVFAVLLPWLTAYAVVLAVGLRFVSRQWGAA